MLSDRVNELWHQAMAEDKEEDVEHLPKLAGEGFDLMMKKKDEFLIEIAIRHEKGEYKNFLLWRSGVEKH